MPLIFIYLAIVGSVDIFQLFEESGLELKIPKTNTRTLLYEEVWWSMKESGVSSLFGGGASTGYQTDAFYNPLYILTSAGRYQAEVAFLNTLFKSGIVGVIFDMLIFFIPAYFAINRSSNNFSKILGVFLAFSWLFYFIAAPQNVNTFYFFLYFTIGLCLSKSFRESTDAEVKYFFNSI